MQMLFDQAGADQPDGLIIADDNLVPYATAGLIAAGARVGEDIAVVGACNFPWPTHSAVPIDRVGFDAAEILRACLQSIDTQRRTGQPAEHKEIAAVSHSDLQVAGEYAFSQPGA